MSTLFWAGGGRSLLSIIIPLLFYLLLFLFLCRKNQFSLLRLFHRPLCSMIREDHEIQPKTLKVSIATAERNNGVRRQREPFSGKCIGLLALRSEIYLYHSPPPPPLILSFSREMKIVVDYDGRLPADIKWLRRLAKNKDSCSVLFCCPTKIFRLEI